MASREFNPPSYINKIEKSVHMLYNLILNYNRLKFPSLRDHLRINLEENVGEVLIIDSGGGSNALGHDSEFRKILLLPRT